MVALTLRAIKGAPLTHQEVDDNFQNLSDGIDAIPEGRELLTANRTYYVRTDGSNSNDGLADTAGGAWLTLQYAYEYVANNLDLGGFIVTINVADGTHAGLGVGFGFPPIVNGPLYIRGNPTNPENCILTTPISINCIANGGAMFVCISGFTVPSINLGYPKFVWLGCDPTFSESGGVRFTGTYCISVGYEAMIDLYGKLIFTQNFVTGISLLTGGRLNYAYCDEIVFENSPLTVSNAFLELGYNSSTNLFFSSGAVTGTLTGPRVTAYAASTVIGDTGNQTFVPGSVDGAIDATSVLA